MREQGQIDPKYPKALPVLSDLNKETAENLRVMFGSLTYDGQEYLYNGRVGDDGPYWHEVNEMGRFDGLYYLQERMKKVLGQ